MSFEFDSIRFDPNFKIFDSIRFEKFSIRRNPRFHVLCPVAFGRKENFEKYDDLKFKILVASWTRLENKTGSKCSEVGVQEAGGTKSIGTFSNWQKGCI